MPRETIRSADPASSTVMQIGWGPDGLVQVATVNSAEGAPPGWYMDLDRAGINKAIRTLRRARDAAYGKDE